MEKTQLSPNHRRSIIGAGAVAGVFIAPMGFWLHAALLIALRSDSGRLPPGPHGGWIGVFQRMVTSWFGLLALGLAFVATLVLMPLLVKSLEQRVKEPATKYYRRAASAGVAVGLGATAIITFVVFWAALLSGYFDAEAGTRADGTLTELLLGGMLFGGIAAGVTPLLFIPSVLVFGIPLGLALGYAIRKLAT